MRLVPNSRRSCYTELYDLFGFLIDFESMTAWGQVESYTPCE